MEAVLRGKFRALSAYIKENGELSYYQLKTKSENTRTERRN